MRFSIIQTRFIAKTLAVTSVTAMLFILLPHAGLAQS